MEREPLYARRELAQRDAQRNTSCKNNNIMLFDDDQCDLTEEEKQMIIERLEQQKKRFRELEDRDRRNRITRIRVIYPYLTNEEAIYSLRACDNSEEDAIVRLTDPFFLADMRRRIALSCMSKEILQQRAISDAEAAKIYVEDEANGLSRPRMKAKRLMHTSYWKKRHPFDSYGEDNSNNRTREEVFDDDGDDSSDDDYDDGDADYTENDDHSVTATSVVVRNSAVTVNQSVAGAKRVQSQQSCTAAEQENAANPQSSPETCSESPKRHVISNDMTTSATSLTEETKKKKPRRGNVVNVANLKSSKGTAVAKTSCQDVAMEGWSQARIRAYNSIHTNPNAYYYRFNAPGEEQKQGPWTKEERRLFMERLEEMNIIGQESPQWGIFSMAIPNRVGYQCSSFYRKLIRDGEIEDPNYSIDDDGKLIFLPNKGKKRRVTRTTPLQRDTSKRKRKSGPGEEEDVDIQGSSSRCKRIKMESIASGNESRDVMGSTGNHSREARECHPIFTENPLPNFKDPITMEDIEVPAISPFGYVMEYRTYLRILSQEPKNICPFTKQALYKRDLVKLTWDNIEKYREKIVNKPND